MTMTGWSAGHQAEGLALSARVLVVDDDRKITSILRRGLEYEGYQVTVANDGEEGLRLAGQTHPQVVILDVAMPGTGGLDVCRRLRTFSQVPVLMLTAKDEVSDRVAGLDSGADDYLVKPFDFDELLARLRALLRRTRGEAESVLRYADLELNLATREAHRSERSFELTTKEFELLSLFLRHPRQVLSRDTIMDRIWGLDYSGESNVLEVYVGYLRQKLEAGGEPRLLHTLRGAGYTLRE